MSANLHAGIISEHENDFDYQDLAQDFPSVIKIFTDQGYCSAVIVSPKWVITTKHSIQNRNDIQVAYAFQEYSPQKIVFHKTLDIALIKVNLPECAEVAEIAPIKNLSGSVCQIVGYGRTGRIKPKYYDLEKRAGNNKVTCENKDFINCKFTKDSDIKLQILIAKGDSGGGVFLNNKLVAINSFVKEIEPEGAYEDVSGHVKISSVYDWIISNIK